MYMYHTCIYNITSIKQITLYISSTYPRTSDISQPMTVAFFDLSQVPRLFGIHQQPIKGRRQAPTAAVALIIQDLDGLGSCRKLWCLWDHLGHLTMGECMNIKTVHLGWHAELGWQKKGDSYVVLRYVPDFIHIYIYNWLYNCIAGWYCSYWWCMINGYKSGESQLIAATTSGIIRKHGTGKVVKHVWMYRIVKPYGI